MDELWRRVESRDTWSTEEEKRAYRDGVDRARAVYRRIVDGATR